MALCLLNSNVVRAVKAGKEKSPSGLLRLSLTHYDGLIGTLSALAPSYSLRVVIPNTLPAPLRLVVQKYKIF